MENQTFLNNVISKFKDRFNNYYFKEYLGNLKKELFNLIDNYDNVNNRFEVYGEGIEYVTMQVYNRIGEKIFESSNQQVGWDGTYKGELQNPGVYTYYVSVEYLDGKVIDRKGSVTLIR